MRAQARGKENNVKNDVTAHSVIAFVVIACVFAGFAEAQRGEFAPEDAFVAGSSHPFYGSENPWDRRFFTEHIRNIYGRRGQRQMLDIIEGRAEDTVKYCQRLLASEPDDLESLFNLTVARSTLGDYTGAMESMNQAVEAGLPFSRFLAGPRDLLKPLHKTAAFREYAAKHKVQLIHGPMLGCLTDTTAKFWVRTADEVSVQVVAGTSRNLYKPTKSKLTSTCSERDYTAVVEVEGLRPDTLYYYDAVLNGESVLAPELPSFHTYPPRGSKLRFKVAFGGGAGYCPPNERMWDTILSHEPAALLMLGDNVYIDLPQQYGDFHRYTYYRRQSRPEWRQLVSSVPVFAVWDDHDCATDDVWMGPYRDKPGWKMSMLEGFRINWNNPGYGDDEWPGCWFNFSIADVDFFMLDGRFYRTNPFDENPTMLGPVQKEWLLEQLRKSSATFKVLVSPVAWTFFAKGGALDTWNGFRAERDEIFSFLSADKIDGVVLLSADRHRSEAWRIDREDDYTLLEFMSSRLTNQSVAELKPGTVFAYNQKQSFGLLTFDTTKPDPTVVYDIVSIDNELIHRLTVSKSEISHQ